MNKNDKIGLIGLLVIIVFATGFIVKACNYNAEKEEERERERIERENHFNSLIDSLASVNIDSTPSSADTIKEPTSQPVPQTSTPNPNSQTDKTDEREHEAYREGYDEGYEQGEEDGSNGSGHGFGYDDTNYYKSHSLRMLYEQGYDDGYNDGYSSGKDEYWLQKINAMQRAINEVA